MLNVLAEFYRNDWAILPSYMLTAHTVIEQWANGTNTPNPAFGNKELNSPSLAFEESGSVYVIKAESGFGSSAQRGVAVIPIMGAITKRAGMFDQVSGLQSSEKVIGYINQANADPNIRSILLHIDSPGGAVDGTEELARVIKESAKPVIAFVDGMAASAAYWAASQCSQIIVKGQTSEVGSIGVLCTHVDASGYYDQMGTKYTYITSDRAKDKVVGPDTKPLSDEDSVAIRSHLNAIHDVFISTVKSGRRGKLSQSEDVFTGKMYMGDRAVQEGLADKIGTFESAIRAAISQSNKSNSSNKTEMELPKLTALLGKKEPEAVKPDVVVSTAELEKVEGELAAKDIQLADAIVAKEAAENKAADLENKLASSQEQLNKANSDLQTLQAENARLAGKGVEQTPGSDGGEPGQDKPLNAGATMLKNILSEIPESEKILHGNNSKK